ncbi:hypothetical protein D3C87_888130 [compost metagenome]
MKRKQTVKGKDYPLSANSKLASLEFSKAANWASQIYAVLKLHERHLCDRSVFQKLNQLLVKVYATDDTHALGAKKLFAGDVEMLTKLRLGHFGEWNVRLGIGVGIKMEPSTGKATITISKFILSANQLVDRARQTAMRFYVYLLDEEKELLKVEVTDDLLVDFNIAYKEIEAKFDFPPVSNGVLLLLGVHQFYLATTDLRAVFASSDRRYYQANFMQALAIKDGKLFDYQKKVIDVAEVVNIPKVAWYQK